MKRSAAIGPGVSLFPFLAVLLCTMGALVVVLVVINRQVRAKAVAAASETAAQNEEIATTAEELAFRIEQLTRARQKTLADLDTARRRLSGIEDHSRRLKKQLQELTAAAQQMPAGSDATAAQRDALRSALLRLNTERMRLEAELAKARRDAKFRKPAFAIVPFDGVYKTNRRPIYIECRANSVILQPEGIVFTAADFLGPGGPGNPLASALRAAREYWSQQPPPAADIPNEPYPLLLVRPDGISGYYLAREAMASWDSEFGYELVDADWKIEFPEQPAAQLIDMEKRAVAEARQRLEWLAQVSPERFARKSKTQYRLSPIRGGLVRDGAASLGNDPFADDPLGGFGRSTGSGDQIGTGGPTGSGGNHFGADPRGGSALGNNRGPGNYGIDQGNGFGGNSGNNGFATGDSRLGSGNTPFGGNASGGALEGYGSGDAVAGLPQRGGSNSDPSNGASSNGIGPELGGVGPRYSGLGNRGTGEYDGTGGDQTGGSPGALGQNPVADASGSPDNGGASGGSALEGSDAVGAPNFTAANAGGSAAGASSAMGQSGGATGSSSSSSDPSAMSAGTPSPTLELNPTPPSQRTASRSIADRRGRNWALPADSNASLPITRPIRIECWSDRLVILPDARDRQAQVVRFERRTEDSIEEVVAAVREHSQRWGIAGRGMYWKPQLVLQVNPNAEARADDLQVLLAGSGLDVKRK